MFAPKQVRFVSLVIAFLVCSPAAGNESERLTEEECSCDLMNNGPKNNPYGEGELQGRVLGGKIMTGNWVEAVEGELTSLVVIYRSFPVECDPTLMGTIEEPGDE